MSPPSIVVLLLSHKKITLARLACLCLNLVCHFLAVSPPWTEEKSLLLACRIIDTIEHAYFLYAMIFFFTQHELMIKSFSILRHGNGRVLDMTVFQHNFLETLMHISK